MRMRMLALKAIGAATILLAASGYVAADSYVLLGNGVCRPAGDAKGEVFPLRGASWEKCREVCSSRKCGGIEFNLRPDGTECEHHYYDVKMQVVQQPTGKLHSCWVRQN